MSDWRPSSGPDVARRRAGRLAVVREFFAARDVLEVDVPALVNAPVSDPNIASLAIGESRIAGRRLYLHTSPEYAMKRLLAAGYPDIFAIARVFRDGEHGSRHEPEFTMVEWYRREFDLEAMSRETCELIAAVLEQPALAENARAIQYSDAFQNGAGIDPFTAGVGVLAEAAQADDALQNALGERRDAWLDLLLGTRIAPSFPDDRLTVLTHYPASQAALSRIDPDDERVALRFEVFLGEVELANGYLELCDGNEQRARFEADQRIRAELGEADTPVDELLLEALDQGLPPCAGVALGFERLHMLHEGVDNIADVVTFGFAKSLP